MTTQTPRSLTRSEPLTDAEIYSLLRHPDGMVRSHADWLREYRGNGWRILAGRNLYDYDAAQREEIALKNRIASLEFQPSSGVLSHEQ